MKKYSCMIIDDEELSRNLLEHYINRVPHLHLTGKFSNPLSALVSFKKESVDIIFLDIQMPEISGIEFLKSLIKAPAVIFTTAYDQFALEGYNLSVIDYLLKPFSFTRYLQAVNKATELIDLRQIEKNEILQQDRDPEKTNLEFLLINADHKIHRIYLKKIIYIQSMKEYVVYHMGQEKLMALGSLKGLDEKLPSTKFIRVHKSYIVAKESVKNLSGNQLDIGIKSIPIGPSYRDNVLKNLF